MTPINSPSAARQLLRDQQREPARPIKSIWQYVSSETGSTHLVAFSTNYHHMHTDPCIHSPVLLWTHLGGLTIEGETFLQEPTQEHPQ